MKKVIYILLLISVSSCQTQNKKTTSKVKTTENTQSINSSKDEFAEDKSSKVVSNNPNGEYLELYANGKIKIEGQKKDGLRNGVWYSYFENGNKWSETSYINGQKNGVSIVNYPNGKIHYKGQYKNDKKSGNWYFYKEDGNLDYEENY
jgi:antitoxin component YwqK of YwqJK toxin-antitoxin module